MLIAQITDTHIKADGKLAYRKVDTAGALSACVTHINQLEPQPDAVIVTGDLVDAGQLAEYSVFRALIDKLDMPYYVIPGNHDDRNALKKAFLNHAYLPSEADFLHYVIEKFDLRLIGLDTTIPGEAHGTVCDTRLHWLDETLAAVPEKATLIFMHHPPFLTGIEHMDVQKCGNADALAAVIQRHKQVRHIACGHVHRAIDLFWNGIPASIGPSPSHAVALSLIPKSPSTFVVEPAACRLFNFSGDQLVGHLSFIGEFEGPYPFFAADGALIE